MNYHPRHKICVSGAADTEHCGKDAIAKAELVGKIIARRGLILVTGATTGLPFWAAKGAKEEGGIVIGISPAASLASHVHTYHLPTDYHDLIIYTGFEYAGRNLLLIRSSDAVITLCGRMGTLNEFTIGFEDKRVQGVLLGTGGTTEMIPEIIERAHRGPGKVIFDDDPERLVEKVVARIEEEEKKTLQNHRSLSS